MNDCAKGMLQAALGVPLAVGFALGGGLLIRGALHVQTAEAATAKPMSAPTGEALTIYHAGSVEFYSGRFDVASTHARRVEMHAADYSGGAGKPPAGMLDDGYEVTVYAADGVAFAAEDCALLGADMMAGGAHWYMRCD